MGRFGQVPGDVDLVGQVAQLYDGMVDGPALAAAFREAAVIVPTDGHDALLTTDDRGVCWVYAFTTAEALARFASVRGEGDRPWPYLTTRGGRLLDVVLPEIGRPAGIAVDVGGRRPFFLPPTSQHQEVA
ncbi:MAG TPA: SseB family protein [Pseudonocardiaceae bacterium]|nr:SseB family protein [Pseudonocardiaceae bacterium]